MRIKHIDILRGIAAVLVTIFHLTGNSALSKDTVAFGKYGYLGVEMFFVISGFVLPYSLLKSGYQLKNFFTFFFKRIIRIYPAYIAAIIISIVLAALSGRGLIKWESAFLHLTFFNSAFGYNDISPVFWTLKIEFGFYILVGLFFNYFFTSSYKSVILISVILGLAMLNTSTSFISWLPFFALGILIFNRRFNGMNPIVFWTMSAIIALICFKIHGLPEAFAACFAVLFIMYAKPEHFPKHISKILLWLGMISYSLYLVHWELGRSAVAIFRHVPVIGGPEALRVIAGICFSIICAFLLYKLVEKPSIRFAGKIQYKRFGLLRNQL
jgi:peptidoglycan/LPS O-acetylase OafA/YrhL